MKVGVFVINLKDSLQRWDRLLPKLTALPWPFIRIDAIDARTHSFNPSTVNPTAYRHLFGKNIGRGTWACALSHHKAWSCFLNSPYDFALVCEDDVCFDPQILSQAVEQLAFFSQWDICSFQINHKGCPIPLKKMGCGPLCVYLFPVSGAGCYLVSRKAARILLSKALPMTRPIDHYLIASWIHGLVFTGIEPRLAWQDQTPSLIDDMGREERYAQSPWSKICRAFCVMRVSVLCAVWGLFFCARCHIVRFFCS